MPPTLSRAAGVSVLMITALASIAACTTRHSTQTHTDQPTATTETLSTTASGSSSIEVALPRVETMPVPQEVVPQTDSRPTGQPQPHASGAVTSQPGHDVAVTAPIISAPSHGVHDPPPGAATAAATTAPPTPAEDPNRPGSNSEPVASPAPADVAVAPGTTDGAPDTSGGSGNPKTDTQPAPGDDAPHPPMDGQPFPPILVYVPPGNPVLPIGPCPSPIRPIELCDGYGPPSSETPVLTLPAAPPGETTLPGGPTEPPYSVPPDPHGPVRPPHDGDRNLPADGPPGSRP